MKKCLFAVITLLVLSTTVMASEGVVSLKSHYSVSETATRFERLLKQKGFTVFSRVDHAANAKSVDLTLRPTEVIIFGNPKVGTLLMQCAQTVAIDLPQKALFWQDEKGTVWMSYNDPAYLKERHGIKGCDQVLKKVEKVLSTLSVSATSE